MNADGDDQGVDPSPGASTTITTIGATGVVGAGASTDSSAVAPDTVGPMSATIPVLLV